MFLKLYYSKPSFETATVSSNIVSPAAASVKINEVGGVGDEFIELVSTNKPSPKPSGIN